MANVLHAKELNERYANKNVQAFAVHPGGIMTGLQATVPWHVNAFFAIASPFFFKTIAQGAATSIYCAIHPAAKLTAGRFHQDCNVSLTKKEEIVNDAELRQKFWSTSERLVKDFKE